jgi:hypothetical protein
MAENKTILHVLKSEPDDVVKLLIDKTSEGNKARQYVLYNGSADYDELIDLIFECDQTVSWW